MQQLKTRNESRVRAQQSTAQPRTHVICSLRGPLQAHDGHPEPQRQDPVRNVLDGSSYTKSTPDCADLRPQSQNVAYLVERETSGRKGEGNFCGAGDAQFLQPGGGFQTLN